MFPIHIELSGLMEALHAGREANLRVAIVVFKGSWANGHVGIYLFSPTDLYPTFFRQKKRNVGSFLGCLEFVAMSLPPDVEQRFGTPPMSTILSQHS